MTCKLFASVSLSALSLACVLSSSAYAVDAVSSDSAAADDQAQQLRQQDQRTETDQSTQAAPPVLALRDWTYDDIYANGWSAEQLLDNAEVVDVEGEGVGSVENILIGEDGRILSVIAEVGGFLDIGDTHVSVPWDQVQISPDMDTIQIPVDDDTVDEYSIYGEWGYYTQADAAVTNVVNDDLTTSPSVWKATELLDDYAILSGNMSYGYVRDLIFTQEGELHAVVVNAAADLGGGTYAYPFYGYGYGWTPADRAYDLQYGRDDLPVIKTFDYGKMRGSDELAEQQSSSGSDQSTTTN
jgi:sporulation protein YlmC with PRC-barrel domain